MSHRLFSLVLLVALSAACSDEIQSGSSGTVPEPFLDVSGTWTGTWASDGPPGESGTIVIVLDQFNQPGATSVTALSTTLTGSSCFTTGACLLTNTPQCFLTVGDVTLTGSLIRRRVGPPPSPALNFNLTAELDVLGLQMNGTYRIAQHSNAACVGQVGTIAASRPD